MSFLDVFCWSFHRSAWHFISLFETFIETCSPIFLWCELHWLFLGLKVVWAWTGDDGMLILNLLLDQVLLNLSLSRISHVKNMAKNYSFMDLSISTLISICKLDSSRSEFSTMTSLSVDRMIKLLYQWTSVHHTLFGSNVFSISSNVNYYRLMLWQRCLKVGFFPLKLFKFIVGIIFDLLLVRLFPRETEVLKV